MRRFAAKLKGLFGSRGPRKTSRLSRRPLTLEALEGRVVPANASGVFSGIAFIDVNGTGHFGAGDFALPAEQVTLTGTTAEGAPVSAVTSTDANGFYSFLNLLPGTYQLSAAFGPASRLPNGSAGGSVASGLTLAEGQTIRQDFGFRGVAPAGISLRLFLTTTTPFQPFLKSAIQNVSVGKNAADTKIDLAANFSDLDVTDSMVRIDTTDGPINVELFDAAAPQTVANFLNYVQSGAYNNSIFHRLVSGFVLQGGGFTFNAGRINPIPTNPPVANEFGASNVRGTLAMAKVGNDPNSATNQFFFNLANNSSNLDKQNGGFTVFGRIVDSAGLTVLDNLAATQINTRQQSPFDSIPLNRYNGTNFPTDATDANFIKINDVAVLRHDENLAYSVVGNDNPGLVTATTLLTDNPVLNLSYAHNQVGTAHVTVRATDHLGITSDATFTVNVGEQAPTATVTLNSASPQASDTLTATAKGSDPDGDPVTLTYVWQVNGTTVKTTTTGANAADTLDLTGIVKPGDVVTVRVTPNDGTVDGTPATATATVASPSAGAVSLSNPPTTGQVVATLTNANAKSFTYVWTLNGAVVQTDTITATTDTLNHAIQTGDQVSVEVTPMSGTLTGTAVTAAEVINAPLVTNLLLDPSNPSPTATMMASAAAPSDPNGDPIVLTYVWMVNSTVVKTTSKTPNTTDTLDLTTVTPAVMSGDKITVTVTPNNGTIDGPPISTSRNVV